MSFEPKFTDDRKPRWIERSDGGVFFRHPCMVCGRLDAAFGYNCTKTNLGDWYCYAHRPEVTASTQAPNGN